MFFHMAPHTDTSPSAAKSVAARAPAPTALADTDTMDITFVCRGYVDMIEDVPRKTKMMMLRPRICVVLHDVLGIEVTPPDIRMWTLKREDGSWEGDAELEDVEGQKTALSKTVGSELKGAPEEGVVHLRVRKDPIAPPPQDEDDEASDFETAAMKFNNGCVKVVGSKSKLSVEDCRGDC
ncbi:hypothetical protein BBJ28_00022991 [Nothophytophthora sp. Chile5]|nr:hypothetical protein BBJ28_00022991 [Nothophytophthora sp. Chile5]